MAENKTKQTRASVTSFLAAIDDPSRRADCRKVATMMRRATGEAPRMWGERIVGFGSYHYRYASGHEGDAPIVGFSPRKQDLTLYVLSDFAEKEELLARLGKHKTGKSCLYVKRLADVDIAVLEELVDASVAHQRRRGTTD